MKHSSKLVLLILALLVSGLLAACSGFETGELVGRSDMPAPEDTFSHTLYSLYKTAGEDKNEKNGYEVDHYFTGAPLAQASYVRGKLSQHQTVIVYDGEGRPQVFSNMSKTSFTQGMTRQYETKISKIYSVGRKEVNILVRLKQEPEVVNAVGGRLPEFKLQTLYVCPLDAAIQEPRDYEAVKISYGDCTNKGTLISDGWSVTRLFGYDNIGLTYGLEGDLYTRAGLPADWFERNEVYAFQAVTGILKDIQDRLSSQNGWVIQPDIAELEAHLQSTYNARLYLLGGDADRFTFSRVLLGRVAPVITCFFLDPATSQSECLVFSVEYDAKWNNLTRNFEAFYHFGMRDLFGDDGTLKNGIDPNDSRLLAVEKNGWMNSPIPDVSAFTLSRYNFSAQAWEPVARADVKAFLGANRTTLFLHTRSNYLFDPAALQGEMGKYPVPEQNCGQNVAGNPTCYDSRWWDQVWMEKSLLKYAYRQTNDDPNLLATAQIYFDDNSQYDYICDREDDDGDCTSGHYQARVNDLTAEYYLGGSQQTQAWMDFIAIMGEQYARRVGFWFMEGPLKGNGLASAIGLNWELLHPDSPYATLALELGGVVNYPDFLRQNQFIYPDAGPLEP